MSKRETSFFLNFFVSVSCLRKDFETLQHSCFTSFPPFMTFMELVTESVFWRFYLRFCVDKCMSFDL